MHTQRELPKPTTACGAADLVQPLIHSLRSYETVPNRREMIYDNMFELMLKASKLSAPDSLDAAILDWIILGRVTGARKSEWCQDSQTVQLTPPNIFNVPQQPLAFLFKDFTFWDHHHRRIHSITPTTIALVASVTIEWRFQKNKNNGEKIPFARDSKRPAICPVLAALRICLRAKRLNLPADAPLAVYNLSSSSNQQFSYITSAQVTAYIRRSAQAAFGLKKTDPMLQKWSCHSIRVTAANLLYRAKMSDSYIQTRLRWKSKAFLDYLRNTFYSAKLHTDALAISPVHLPTLETDDGLQHREPTNFEQLSNPTTEIAP